LPSTIDRDCRGVSWLRAYAPLLQS
jgi:hypothetical protein